MVKSHNLFALTFSLVIIGIAAPSLFGCSADNNPAPEGVETLLPWPPPADNVRAASDDTVVRDGVDYDIKNGDATDQGLTLKLKGGTELPYAIYSLGGFGSGIELANIALDFTRQVQMPGDGTDVYVALSNYSWGGWQWFKADPPNWSPTIYHGEYYRSPAGNIHVAVVLSGPGSATINSLGFERVGDTGLAPPQNITYIADLMQISLDWEDVDGATGYHVYRALDREFTTGQHLTEGGPVVSSDYIDGPAGLVVDRIYYYKVSSVEPGSESARSPYVDVYSPQVDLPLPTLVNGYAESASSFKIDWFWLGDDPHHFNIYYSEFKDFNMYDSPTLIEVPGWETEYTMTDLPPNTTFYWRLCANDQFLNGRMTDDVYGGVEDFYEWGPAETIGAGGTRLVALEADGDLTTAYHNGDNVDVARRNGGTWTAETALAGTYVGFLDITYGSGKYVVAGQDGPSSDLWAATGAPGDWDVVKVDGDGRVSPSPRDFNGYRLKTAVVGSDFFLSQLKNDAAPAYSFVFHTQPLSGGAWSAETLAWDGVGEIGNYYNSCYSDGDNVWYLVYDGAPMVRDLYIADLQGGWVKESVMPAGMERIGPYNDLTRFDDQWFTPAYDEVNKNFYILNGTTGPWTATLVHESTRVGENGSMVATSDKLFTAYQRRDVSVWMLGVFDGSEWKTGPIFVDGANIELNVDGGLVVTAIGDTPYIVFADPDDGMIKAAVGTPPA